MTLNGHLLIAAIGFPIVLAAACTKMRNPAATLSLLPLAPLPGLLAALLATGEMVEIAPAPIHLMLALDMPGALLLGSAALLWTGAGLYARAYMRGSRNLRGFSIGWLLSLSGSLGCFLVADIASFYLVFSLVSLSAYWLVSHEGTPAANRAALIYMILAIAGEAVLLLGFVMLATIAHEANPLISDAVALVSASPWRDATIGLLVLGFGMKMGLAPMHVWMPLAHPVAPMPASAVLSGIVVKAGVIGLIRFLPFDAGLAGWGMVLMTVGLGTAFYAVAIGIFQQHPKTVLAYSTVSQMGFVAALAGAGLAVGDASAGPLAAFYAIHHMLVKGALFLGVGVVAATGRGRLLLLIPCVVLSLSLAGLPLTSGALAKFAGKMLFGDGIAASLATASAAGSALLMLHFMRLLARYGKADATQATPPALVLPWALVAVASFAVPFLLFTQVTGYALSATLVPYALWAAIVPIIAGAVLAALLARYGRLGPSIPEGDIVVAAEAAVPFFLRAGDALERADVVLRRWPVTGVVLLGMAIALGMALVR